MIWAFNGQIWYWFGGVVVFCFEIRGCFGGVRTVPHFGLFFQSRRARRWHYTAAAEAIRI
jgi:hypothetical protein